MIKVKIQTDAKGRIFRDKNLNTFSSNAKMKIKMNPNLCSVM